MSNRYVGHRYIPLFDGEWDKSKTYESLTFVHYQSKTYVSRQFVPTQIDIENNEFWAFFMEYTPEVFTPIFSGEWDNTKEYTPLSTVVNVNKSYFSKQFVPTGVDINNEDYWVDITTYYQNLLVDFEKAEQERKNAELIRIENENQRNADKVVLNNLVENGDFSNGSLGWKEYLGGKIEVIDSRLKVSVSTTNYSGTRQDTNVSYALGDIIYTNVSVNNPNDYNIRLNFQYFNKTNLVKISPTFNGVVSIVDKAYISASSIIYYITKNSVSDQYSFFIDNVILLNLTNIFGAGKEPTKEEMDELVKVTGYIDEEYALNNKEMLIWTLALIRRNKNAITSLGGTI